MIIKWYRSNIGFSISKVSTWRHGNAYLWRVKVIW